MRADSLDEAAKQDGKQSRTSAFLGNAIQAQPKWMKQARQRKLALRLRDHHRYPRHSHSIVPGGFEVTS